MNSILKVVMACVFVCYFIFCVTPSERKGSAAKSGKGDTKGDKSGKGGKGAVAAPDEEEDAGPPPPLEVTKNTTRLFTMSYLGPMFTISYLDPMFTVSYLDPMFTVSYLDPM